MNMGLIITNYTKTEDFMIEGVLRLIAFLDIYHNQLILHVSKFWI